MRFSDSDFSECATPIDIISSRWHRAYPPPCYRHGDVMARVGPREKSAKNRIGAKPGGPKNRVARTSMYKLMGHKVKDMRSDPVRKARGLNVPGLGENTFCAVCSLKVKGKKTIDRIF